jgi:branched-chain amino acid aminotransferase
LDQLSWSISDVGTMFGAILVERMRTYQGKLLDLCDHRERLVTSAQKLGIQTSYVESQFEFACHRVLERNAELVNRMGDVGIAFLLSPGEFDSVVNNRFPDPTCMVHLSPLPISKLEQWNRQGVELIRGAMCTVPGTCWPVQMKTRSRLPYFLSDLQACNIAGDQLTVLTTTRGTIADTAMANILMVDRHGSIVSPPWQDILVGCTLKNLARLLDRNGTVLVQRDIKPEEFGSAREVILTGTSGGVWHASKVDGELIGDGHPGPELRRMKLLWDEHVLTSF